MSKTVLATVDGFTPVIDAVVQDVGLMTATVFGKVWRYCQMEDGVCKAGQDRLASELGITRQTVNAHIDKLVENGYLRDNTPGLLGVPHTYSDTGKAGLSISFTATCQNSIQPPVKNFDTKRVLKKENKTDDIPERRTSATIKGDLVDGMSDFAQMPNAKKAVRLLAIESIIKVTLNVNPGKRWHDFIEFADARQQKDGQHITVFLNWLIGQPGFDISFWPPAKLQENWPRAFAKSYVEKEEPVPRKTDDTPGAYVPAPAHVAARILAAVGD